MAPKNQISPKKDPESIKDAGKLFDKIARNLPSIEIWEHVGDREAHNFRCDDRLGILTVSAGPDGDLHAWMSEGDNEQCYGPPTIRARTYSGGGNSERVRRALMLLALAIKADSR